LWLSRAQSTRHLVSGIEVTLLASETPPLPIVSAVNS
jgi:hypothetical protein